MNLKNFFAELKRRNVFRAGALYVAGAWALAQGVAQLLPVFGAPDWVTRWIVIAEIIGFPFWVAFAWFYEFTPTGLKRESEIAPDDSIAHSTGRKLDFWIIGILALAVVLLLTDRFVVRKGGASVAIPEKSIAVLPFENLSSDKDNAYFADGVQDEILTDLAKIADLKVISRTSVMQYGADSKRNSREIGEQLGVANLLEGSVQRVSGKVRVDAQLINVRTDAHEWAQSYDRPLDDVFAIQSEIAKAIADQLQAKLSPSEKTAIEKKPTSDLEAYQFYLRAQTLFTQSMAIATLNEKLTEAARLLDEAVGRDPQFLLAWCVLAKVQSYIYVFGIDHTPARLALADKAVQTALRLQPDSGEAHLAQADYYYNGLRDYGRARAELELARRTLPNSAEVFKYTGYIDRREGRWEESNRNLQRALELDPRDFVILQQLAYSYQYQRRYPDQVRMYDRALMIVPGDPFTRINRAQVAFHWRANLKPYEETLATLLAEDPRGAAGFDDPQVALATRDPAAITRALANIPAEGTRNDTGAHYPRSFWEGLAAHFQGDAAKAEAALTSARTEVEKDLVAQPDDEGRLSALGQVDALLGHKEEALREGRGACELLPISKDAVRGPELAENLAQIYVWTGEKDLAMAEIGILARTPNGPNYGDLKLSPYWDSLRGDPRFEKIVASLAPK